ncbi:protein TMED8 isoform X2 [Rhinoderma darwinii]|uniref:protein TMED8 isoform X2 n=1 Tax=Rhinoderma darwinii TaxID=43563 RepID=UPI003F66B8EC
MALAQDAADVSGELSGAGGADSDKSTREQSPEIEGTQEEARGTRTGDESQTESGASTFNPQQTIHLDSTSADRSQSDLKINTTRPPQGFRVGEEARSTEPTKEDVGEPDGDTSKTTDCNAATETTDCNAATETTDCIAATETTDCIAATETTDCIAATETTDGNAATETTDGNAATDATNTANKTLDRTKTTPSQPSAESTKTALDKELEALLSLGPADPPPHDVLMIQSEHNGTVDIVKADTSVADPGVPEGKVPPPPLRPATTWTSANLREFKHRMANEKHGLLTIRRGEVVTVRVPTHPDGKRLCWEFATDDYDIGFGIYFDWTPVTSTAVTLQGTVGRAMWSGGRFTACAVDMVKSCRFTGGTVTERCRQEAMTIREKGSIC